jgi:CRP/FNR family cyclic AMP-dependent transcriptional regulator
MRNMAERLRAVASRVAAECIALMPRRALQYSTFKEKERKEKALGAKASAVTDRASPKLPSPQWHSHGKTRCEGSKSNEVYQALIASGIFGRTDPDVVSAVSGHLRAERFPSARFVDAQSDFGGRLYVIISGKVKISYRRPDGYEIVLTILGPSQIFGAKTLFDPDSRGFSITTLTEVLAVPIKRDQLLTWMAEHPEINEQLLRLFARWAKETTNRLVDFAYADAESRIATRLLLLRQRFGRREGEVVRVVHDLTMDDFSLLVGVAPEAINATLHDFEARGWIRLEHNSIVIADAQALRSVRLMGALEVCHV